MSRKESDNQSIHEADNLLGQFIPLHYHFQMLEDEARMSGFKSAIESLVPEGGKVLDLGAGTGILSYFAAQKASLVYSVERHPEMVECARRLLSDNGCTGRVEVIRADVRAYLPPEPVDVVVCEMLHSALLREKQTEVIQSFKDRYREKFGEELPIFIPDTTILGIQPVQADFSFHGYQAPISMFEDPGALSDRFTDLGDVTPYHFLEYKEEIPLSLAYNGPLAITRDGTFNALRFVTKNILSMDLVSGRTVDWFNLNLVLPTQQPLNVASGDTVQVSFNYDAGGEIQALQSAIEINKL